MSTRRVQGNGEWNHMPAYVIGNIDVLNEEASLAYASVAQKSILSHGGRYLVAGPAPDRCGPAAALPVSSSDCRRVWSPGSAQSSCSY
ncbi:DUF1330 domain-containing protein [Streptomyces sp. NEAU-L66]|uniref:DUF1330 domain-containing protein n=1 Tax=Streptomyces sp. NEAU-L66 TaxID=3390812 RepID=UPI0039C72CD8